jgi:hypothetical protein
MMKTRNSKLQHMALCAALTGAVVTLATPAAALDICGCAGHPDSLGALDITDSSTYPPGSTFNGGTNGGLTIPLPDDGVLIFDSIRLVDILNGNTYLRFVKNGSNTPVRLLVAGDVLVGSSSVINVAAADGGAASNNTPGTGGLPGPGGFRGGDGAYLNINGARDGGDGLGPGGGAAGTADAFTAGAAGIYVGRGALRPLVGGSGGGGGASNGTSNCSAGGGGGGGGAILIAADGTVTVNGIIDADGGNNSNTINGTCATNGGDGAGGAIRVIAETINGSGTMVARTGRGSFQSLRGRIRMEAINNTFRDNGADPIATRVQVLSPLVNPLTPSIAITAVDGTPVPEVLQGSVGGVDFVVSAPGVVNLQVETSNVPAGTTVEVAVKPRIGGTALRETVLLEQQNCDSAAQCIVFASFDLQSNTYFAEAQATFQTP